MSSFDHLRCNLDGGIVTKGVVNEGDVVIDSLRNTGEADDNAALLSPLDQFIDSAMSSVSTYEVDLGDATLNKAVQDLVVIEATAT